LWGVLHVIAEIKGNRELDLSRVVDGELRVEESGVDEMERAMKRAETEMPPTLMKYE